MDYRELQKLVDYLICQGLEGFYVNGSTAEAFLLSEEERNSAIRAVIEANSGRAKVICHVGAISTEQAIIFAKNAEKCGADAVSAISPFYYKFSEAEIVSFGSLFFSSSGMRSIAKFCVSTPYFLQIIYPMQTA